MSLRTRTITAIVVLGFCTPLLAQSGTRGGFSAPSAPAAPSFAPSVISSPASSIPPPTVISPAPMNSFVAPSYSEPVYSAPATSYASPSYSMADPVVVSSSPMVSSSPVYTPTVTYSQSYAAPTSCQSVAPMRRWYSPRIISYRNYCGGY